MKSILVTGGAGFIGSHVIRRFLSNHPEYTIVNYDKLTYAGNLENLSDIDQNPNYHFVKGDILDSDTLNQVFDDFNISGVIHLAAESHVDRSISNPMEFIQTNLVGTVTLLNVARSKWEGKSDTCFYHISTDEVYGSLGETGMFTETTAYDPRSPYSASKAGSDHLVRAYYHTFGLPIKISNCSNNYGSHQFPEKLIPLMINNILHEKTLPVYGAGENVRDWLWVEDHAIAIDKIYHEGVFGETYNIGGHNEWKNIDLVKFLCDTVDEALERPKGDAQSRITFVKDRAGHDMRYAIDATKIEKDLDWVPTITFEEGLKHTVKWYLNNKDWLDNLTSGKYQAYYDNQYQNR